jgi:hypothetical protein
VAGAAATGGASARAAGPPGASKALTSGRLADWLKCENPAGHVRRGEARGGGGLLVVADPQASETGRRMPDSAWHWEQGTKYAVETIKALLAINGGAAVALLAFAGNIAKNGGNAASVASHLANSLLGFGLGTLLGALGFLTAYLTQLQYGRGGESFRPAHWWHRATYALVILSALAFVVGLCFARKALLS